MYLDCARAVEIHVTLHEEERTMDTLAPSEEDNISTSATTQSQTG